MITPAITVPQVLWAGLESILDEHTLFGVLVRTWLRAPLATVVDRCLRVTSAQLRQSPDTQGPGSR
jgi:hypothetical protein